MYVVAGRLLPESGNAGLPEKKHRQGQRTIVRGRSSEGEGGQLWFDA